jgi:hypothetical protein
MVSRMVGSQSFSAERRMPKLMTLMMEQVQITTFLPQIVATVVAGASFL